MKSATYEQLHRNFRSALGVTVKIAKIFPFIFIRTFLLANIITQELIAIQQSIMNQEQTSYL